MFKVECVGCQAPYQVDERRVPDKGLKMRCPKCGTTFKVEPPAAGSAPSQAPAAEAAPVAAAPQAQAFVSGGLNFGAKLAKPPTARDSLARTMIGVSSGDREPASKEAPGEAGKPKAFRIPRPNEPAPEPAPVRAAVNDPLLAEEVGLPATPARRALGLSARGGAEPDAGLPQLASDGRRAAATAAGRVPAAPAGVAAEASPDEVRLVLPSAAPAGGGAPWLAGDEVVDAAPRPSSSAAPDADPAPEATARPVATPGGGNAPGDAGLSLGSGLSLEFDPHDNLPAVAASAPRPPPRRPRPAPEAAREPGRAPPERARDKETDLPAVVASPPGPLAPAPRPPERARPAAPSTGLELDLPAFAPRPPAAPAASRSAAPSTGLELDLDLPAFAPRPPAPPRRATPAEATPERALGAARGGSWQPSGVDLPAVGRGLPRPAPPGVTDVPDDLPSVLGGAAAAEADAELPEVLTGARPGATFDVPAGLDAAPAALPVTLATGLPEVFAPGLPAVSSAGLPAVPSAPVKDAWAAGLPPLARTSSPGASSAGLPAASSASLPELLATGLPAVSSAGLPAVSPAGLPDVFGAGLPAASSAGLPAMSPAGLPVVSPAGLPDVFGTGLPAVSPAGLPDVFGTGLPAVSPAGLPAVLAAGLPTVTAPGLPEVLAPGVAGFGRVDLPVPRPAELPDLHAGHLGLDTLDLPGVGESLPSVSESWGEANLPLVGESLPSPRGGGRSIADVESPFGAFEPGAEGDPFAGAEADFGARDGDDPFAGPASVGGEFAPAQAEDFEGVSPRHELAGGAGYGEVQIAGLEADPSPLETAEDMEFSAIPERSSAGPARAAASASVHADLQDAEAAGSTLELGPERRAPKARARRLAMLAALGLGAIGGGALALEPALGPFGIHFVMDQIKRGEREQLLGKLVGDGREAAKRDTFDAVRGVLRELEKARAEAPRFEPLAARSAFEHYAAVLRYGPLPELEATAKVALEQVDAGADEAPVRLARAAQAAAARSADAKQKLEALGAEGDARALLGELCLRQRDWAGASDVWSALSRAEPESARAAFGLARAELGQGRYAEAVSAAQRVLALNPEHVGAPIALLEAQRALHDADPTAREAVPTEQLVAAVLRKLGDAAPGEAALAHSVLGELHASQGRGQPAQKEFEAALLIDRALPRALIGLGEVLHQAGRSSEALARFEAAAKADPSSLSAQLGVAKSQLQLAHLNEAKSLLERLPAADQARPEAIFWTAKVQQALGNAEAALAGYRAAIAAGKGKGESLQAYLSLAKLQAELGQLSAAQDTLSEARAKLPPSGPLYKALGEIAMTRADYGAAYDHFQKALELDAGDTRARFLGAVALTRLGRFEEALRAFQSVSQTDGSFPGLAVERGRLFEVSGRNAEALAEYEAALKSSPDDPEVQTRAGCARVVAGQAAAAQSLLEGTLKLRPRSAEASYCLGRALFEQGRHADALMRLERALDIDPTRAIYHLYSGWVATELGRQAQAQRALDRAIELDKGLGDAYWLRGRLLLKQGAAKDAIGDLDRARQLVPDRHEVLADLAMAYADTGRVPKALELWQQAIAREPGDAVWHFRYGKLLSNAGHGALAANHLQRAIAIAREVESAPLGGEKPKPPVWLWQAHYLLAREVGATAAAIPHWQAYLRLAPHDDPYRSEAERALRNLGQPWAQR